MLWVALILRGGGSASGGSVQKFLQCGSPVAESLHRGRSNFRPNTGAGGSDSEHGLLLWLSFQPIHLIFALSASGAPLDFGASEPIWQSSVRLPHEINIGALTSASTMRLTPRILVAVFHLDHSPDPHCPRRCLSGRPYDVHLCRRSCRPGRQCLSPGNFDKALSNLHVALREVRICSSQPHAGVLGSVRSRVDARSS